jgi:molecular chaperone GrpE
MAEHEETVEREGDGGAQAPPSEPSPDAQAAEPEADAVAEDLDEVTAALRERDEYLELAQRTRADFENYRRRAQKDMTAAETRGVAKLARELFGALDNLDRALAATDGADAQTIDGFRLVRDELLAGLARVGIEQYSPQGETFDPNEHEAMAQAPGGEPGTVLEVYQPGFRHEGSVLRPARVVVAGGGEAQGGQTTGEGA